MLPDLESEGDQAIVADNIRAVQAAYFAQQLENMGLFDVTDRLLQLFQQGQLPLGRGPGRRLLRGLATTQERLPQAQRRAFYARALGAPGGDAADRQTNRDFNDLWMRFVSSVATFERQHAATDLLRPRGVTSARIWRDARALAAHVSSRGAGLADTTRLLASDANRLRAVLESGDIQRSYGARDMWQLVDAVAGRELGGARNATRHRSLATAGSALLQWLAEHAAELSRSASPPAGRVVPDPALTAAVDLWLASSRVGSGSADSATAPGDPLPSAGGSLGLRSVADALLQSLGLQAAAPEGQPQQGADADLPAPGLLACFCGAAGSGKTLAAHALAASLARELVRVDLRGVAGRYIGETEKNLDAVFAQAARSDAVLLIDEADALFGRRTEVKDAHDRYANIELALVLQRVPAHRGVVIVESREPPASADAGAAAGLRHVVRFPLRP